jgi:hypothetical protein
MFWVRVASSHTKFIQYLVNIVPFGSKVERRTDTLKASSHKSTFSLLRNERRLKIATKLLMFFLRNRRTRFRDRAPYCSR